MWYIYTVVWWFTFFWNVYDILARPEMKSEFCSCYTLIWKGYSNLNIMWLTINPILAWWDQVLNQSETVELGKIVGHCQRIHLNIRTRFSKSISQIFKEFFSASSGFFKVKFLNHKSFMTKKTTALLINKDI